MPDLDRQSASHQPRPPTIFWVLTVYYPVEIT